jgi:hypothetical protein
VDFDPATGQQQVYCGDRRREGAQLGQRGKFRWRLMLLDCEQETFTDVTEDALTPTQSFEGLIDSFLTPFDLDCQDVSSTAMPDFFEDPELDCDG